MATIQSTIELQDNFSNVLNNIINSVNLSLSAMSELQKSLNTDVDPSGFQSARDAISQATIAAEELDAALQGISAPEIEPKVVPPVVPDPLVDIPDPVNVPVNWVGDSLEVFTNTGIERFEQEVQSVNTMLNTLNSAQSQINSQAASMSILPANAQTDLSNMATRLQKIQQKIMQIENNPLNVGSEEANTGLEQMRAQLLYAQQAQEALNAAVDSMDVEGANAAYLQLSSTISSTERYIRDNTDEQGKFNTVLEKSNTLGEKLKTTIAGVVSSLVGVTAIISAVSTALDNYDTQLNAELQLATVLGNMLDADTVAEYAVTLDVSEAEAGAAALTDAFDQITAKASEIQATGIYGDEAMIAGAAELATYFSDVDAIDMMMDTLADYAMGMSGGGVVDSEAMVEYATSLGKIMSGSYDAMTKKGFEFTEAQEAIIEGTATEEQIIATLGEEYLELSSDMQAAAAITQVIEESWSGLYETMSDTPEGQIIQMQNAWGDLTEIIGNQLYPYLLLIVEAINENWGTIETVMSALTDALSVVIGILSAIVDTALNAAAAIADNWSWISPIIMGVAAAMLVLNAATIASKIATWAATAAQNAYNAALAVSPVTWVVVAVIALVAAFYAAVAAINQFAGTSISATGLVVGALSTAAAFIGNLFVALINAVIDIFVVLWNFIATFANFFANVFNDPVAAIANLFVGLADTVLGILETLAGAIDTLFGSNLASAVSGWRDSLSGAVADLYGEQEEVMATIDSESLHVDAFDYGEAWSAGYALGESLEDSLSSFSISDFFGTTDTTDVSDYLSGYTYSGSDALVSDVSDISDDTSSISDSLDITDEELKYLRDLAEQEVINRFTTAEINVDMSGITNNVSSQMDLDGLMSGLTDAVNTAVMSMAQGVHA